MRDERGEAEPEEEELRSEDVPAPSSRGARPLREYAGMR